MKKQFFLVVLCVLSTFVKAQTLDQGLMFYVDERTEEAKKSFIAVNKQAPNEIAYYMLGEIYFQEGKTDSASIAYQQGINVNPKYLYNYTGLGKVELQKGNTTAANENFEKVKKGAKKDMKLLLTVADAALSVSKKDTTLARAYINIAQEENPKSPYLHIALGDLNVQKRNIGRAINDYNNAIFYGADMQIAGLKLGSIYTQTNNLKEAEKSYQQIITANPAAILPYKKMGDMFFSFGKYAEAKTAYSTYLSKTVPTIEDKEKFALIQFFNKNYDETEALIKEISIQNQNNPVLFRVRAYSAYERADYQNGINFMNQFFAIQKPEKIIALDYEYYAKLLAKTSNDSLAAINYLKAYEFDSSRYQNLEEAGKTFSKLKKHKEAIACFTKLGKNSQQDKSSVSYLIGKEYYYDGADLMAQSEKTPALKEEALVKLTIADSCFQKVISLSSKFAGGYLWRARSLALIDPDAKTDEAKKAYEVLLGIVQSSSKPDNNNLIECYRYFASYNYLQFERETKNMELKKSFKKLSIEYFEKIIAINPTDQQATDSLMLLKKTD